MMIAFKFDFHIFQKKIWCGLDYSLKQFYGFTTKIDIFQFCICIFSNLDFPFVTYFFLLRIF
jgi:hypothetical protein